MEKLKISENAHRVLQKRYLKKNKRREAIETPEDMFHRVAKTIASADKIYNENKNTIKKTEEEFYQMMVNLEFMPNSPTLMNAGRELGQLSACFVLPIEDSMESIFDAVKSTAMIHKSGGGTGFSFSRLRAKDSIVKTTGGVASGPISFLKVFDAATQAVKQGGTRRGANMGILKITHPDILEFISCKENDKEINNFNISIAVDENFMDKLEKNEDYDLIDPYSRKVSGRLNAGKVFDIIINMAWKNGEPGIIFIDQMNKYNPTPLLGEYESTNPCGEQVLLPYESCNLGSINLLRMTKKVNDKWEVDWDKLKNTVNKAIHFLDNVIDLNNFPLDRIEKNTKLTRKVGLGVMGWGSMLIRLDIPYNSEEAVKLAEDVMFFLNSQAHDKSKHLAKIRGAFPAFKGSVYDIPKSPKLRNATLTTIAPTGTISIIAGPCSSGIEPIFAISFHRNVMDNDKLIEVDSLFKEIAKERGFYSKELMERIAKEGSIHKIEEIPEDVRRIFVTAHDINPEWHIKMQAAFQKYTDNACSKTVNFPSDAKVYDVRQVYMLAHKLKCKGVTIYRDQSRDEQVLNISNKKSTDKRNKQKSEYPISNKILPKPRPKVTQGTTTKIGTGCGSLYVTINVDDEGLPFEIFTQMGKAGGCASSQLEAVARLVSLALRSGIEIKSVIGQLRGIRCPTPAWEKGGRIFSCSDAIAKIIEDRLGKGLKHKRRATDNIKKVDLIPSSIIASSPKGNVVGVCPDCGGALRHQEGCVICGACGYSKC